MVDMARIAGKSSAVPSISITRRGRLKEGILGYGKGMETRVGQMAT
jgi:hypothetical protein